MRKADGFAKGPFINWGVELDGADTGRAYFIDGVDIKDVEIGICSEPVFKETRKGIILGIKGFMPA